MQGQSDPVLQVNCGRRLSLLSVFLLMIRRTVHETAEENCDVL